MCLTVKAFSENTQQLGDGCESQSETFLEEKTGSVANRMCLTVNLSVKALSEEASSREERFGPSEILLDA